MTGMTLKDARNYPLVRSGNLASVLELVLSLYLGGVAIAGRGRYSQLCKCTTSVWQPKVFLLLCLVRPSNLLPGKYFMGLRGVQASQTDGRCCICGKLKHAAKWLAKLGSQKCLCCGVWWQSKHLADSGMGY